MFPQHKESNDISPDRSPSKTSKKSLKSLKTKSLEDETELIDFESKLVSRKIFSHRPERIALDCDMKDNTEKLEFLDRKADILHKYIRLR